MYEFNSRVRYSEIDHHGTLTLPALINYFQDCSTFHSEDLGLGGTFPTEFKGLFGNRNFYIKDERGHMIAKAYSVWVFLDTETGRPVRPEEKDIKPYGMGEALDMPYEGRKISLPEETEVLEAFPVRRYHIDTNEHVNNCQYVQMALEFLPADRQFRQIRVEYKKSAVLGDVIYPKRSREEERTIIELCAENGRPYAVVEFK